MRSPENQLGNADIRFQTKDDQNCKFVLIGKKIDIGAKKIAKEASSTNYNSATRP